MVNFVGFNDNIRNFLQQIYINFHNSFEKQDANVKYYEFIETLKNENFALYKIVIGLSFVDSYRLLKDKENFRQLTEEEINYLEIFKQIEDVEDLFFEIDKNPFVLSSIIYSPIKFNNLNLKEKAHILTLLDDEYVKKFNLFYSLEKYNMFKNRTVEEFIYIYLNNDDETKRNEAINSIINILDLLYIYNFKNFSKLILDMIKVYYPFKKVTQHINPELTFGIDDIIIEIIENKSINDIIYTLAGNNDMIKILVEDFLKIATNKEIKKEGIESIYNDLVSDAVKIKLKEA